MNKFIPCFFIISLLLISCATRRNLKETQVQTLLKTSQSWNGDELPQYSEGTPEITILKITIPPGSRLQVHKHTFINAGVLTKGELTVKTETGQSYILHEGESISELVNTWHYGANTGSGPAEIIVFYAGIKGNPITVLKKE